MKAVDSSHQKRVRDLKETHHDSLSMSEKIGVWCYQHMSTMYCVYLFTGIGAASLVGAITNNLFLTGVFGATSSYLIQLVSLPLITIGQKVEGEKNDALIAEIFKDTELLKLNLKEAMADLKDIRLGVNMLNVIKS